MFSLAQSLRLSGVIKQAAFQAQQQAALKAAEKAADLPGAFTDVTNSPGVRTRSQARKVLVT